MPRESESFYAAEEGCAFCGFLVGAGLGLLVGAGVALALAPQSGEATRQAIKKAAVRVRERLASRFCCCEEADEAEC